MKRETINYFAVGLFVLFGILVLLAALYRMVSGVGDRDVYYTSYRNVAGVTPGTLVTYEGYALGHVSSIIPLRGDQGMYYQVEMQLQAGWQIPDDSIARIYAEGLLADTVVNISEGRSAAFLQPGDAMQGEQGVDLFAAIGAMAGDMSDLSEKAIRPLIENLNRSVEKVGGELESRLPLVLDNVEALVDKLDRSASHLAGILNPDTEQQTRRIIDNVDRTAADFRALSQGLVDVKRDAQHLIKNLDHLIAQSQPELQQAVLDLRQILQQVSRYSDGILQNLDTTSRNMSEFSRQIRENPGRLLGGATPRDRGGRSE